MKRLSFCTRVGAYGFEYLNSNSRWKREHDEYDWTSTRTYTGGGRPGAKESSSNADSRGNADREEGWFTSTEGKATGRGDGVHTSTAPVVTVSQSDPAGAAGGAPGQRVACRSQGVTKAMDETPLDGKNTLPGSEPVSQSEACSNGKGKGVCGLPSAEEKNDPSDPLHEQQASV